MRLKRICNTHCLLEAAEDYVLSCKEAKEGADNKEKERFPNIAGFARSLGVGVDTLKKVQRKYSDQYDAVLALFEDEALNSFKSPTVLTAYLKERLEFGEKKEGGATVNAGDIKLIFEHDISEDGK